MKRFTLLFIFIMTAFLAVNAQESNFKEFYKSHKKDAQISFNIPLFLVRSFIDDEDIDKDIIKKATNFKMLVYNNKDRGVLSDFKKFSRNFVILFYFYISNIKI